jgi:ABC-type Zn2+ transport system substrate-binding protein/surface adhesin
MTSIRTIRWLRAFLLGFFLIAQTAGVWPVICRHALDGHEAISAVAHHHSHDAAQVAAHDEANDPDAHHHRGPDAQDECCTVHVMVGLLPQVPNIAAVASLSAELSPASSAALPGVDLDRLDRPPSTPTLA